MCRACSRTFSIGSAVSRIVCANGRSITRTGSSSPPTATSNTALRMATLLPNVAYTVCQATSARSAICWIVVAA